MIQLCFRELASLTDETDGQRALPSCPESRTQGSPVIPGLHGGMLRPAQVNTLERTAIGPFRGQELGLFRPFCDPPHLKAAIVGFYLHNSRMLTIRELFLTLTPDSPTGKWQHKDLTSGQSDVKASCHFSEDMRKRSSSSIFQVSAVCIFPVKLFHTYFHVSLPTGRGNTLLL